MEQAHETVEQPQDPLYWRILTLIRDVVTQMLIFYFVWGFFKSSSKSKHKNDTKICYNAFHTGQQIFYHVFVSETAFPNSYNTSTLVFKDESTNFMVWNDEIRFNYTFPVSENMHNNGSLYVIACISSHNKLPHFSQQFGYSNSDYACKIHQLTKFKKLKRTGRKNLISGESSEQVTEEIVTNHWHPNITIATLFDNRPFACPGLGNRDIFSDHLVIRPDNESYFPMMIFNEYWNLQADYHPISPENRTLSLFITISPISFFKFQFYMSADLKKNMMFFDQDDSSDDMMKKLVLTTPLYLIVLTVCVSLAHSFFEFLAFKNDIQFWKGRKDLTGLSVSNVLFGLFQSVVVFLYIFDNQGNFMLVIGSGIGCLIDAWKITKVIDVSIDRTRRIGPFPSLLFKDKSTYVESDTKKYDIMALKYLSVVLFPMFIGYSVYSLFYNEHKGWYSFVLSLIYGFLLTFGFIMMTPQLFINYKMKSVAHLPWRMLTYKALNTFIDDIFAFVIHTPTMYRLGCLRDDVIFFVYLYQRWKYPIDKKRVNEFGTTGEDSKPKIE
ncbi:Cleft lip and palate transmembrane protein 1 [Thelohanellus kitauei]|uniref:Cleft lip and palate transmembrane protein 1 n=1 Tax=Thelohanellus kitauei TaxID=669202 RepID=A0A0C2MHD1_THEKT|nr:Cleft lip and palate transmembrane protein 1 [Thelohanellus kitauei]